MGIPLKAFDCGTSLETDSIDDNSDEVPEHSPVILVKIYLYFAANSFWRRIGTLTSCVETNSKREKVVICLQGKELLEKPCTSSCSILCVLQMGLKYRDKQGKWTIDFRCDKNNHALCWGWQIRLSTLDSHHCPQPSGNRACLGLTIWSITLKTGHDFYNIYTYLNAPHSSWDTSFPHQEFGQDGHRHFVGFQPHFHVNMTSQTQCCKIMKKIKVEYLSSLLFTFFETL